MHIFSKKSYEIYRDFMLSFIIIIHAYNACSSIHSFQLVFTPKPWSLCMHNLSCQFMLRATFMIRIESLCFLYHAPWPSKFMHDLASTYSIPCTCKFVNHVVLFLHWLLINECITILKWVLTIIRYWVHGMNK